MNPRIAIIHYGATGHVHQLVEAIAEGARAEGAEVRVRPVAELAPRSTIAANPAWAAQAASVSGLPVATHDDLRWDAYAVGTSSRFGTPAAQLKQFLDTTGGLWAQGVLSDKPVTVFTSADNLDGGLEATVLSLSNVFCHWGAVLVPPGYTDPAVIEGGGNPYGAYYASSGRGADLAAVLQVARLQGARLARYARAVRARRTTRRHPNSSRPEATPRPRTERRHHGPTHHPAPLPAGADARTASSDHLHQAGPDPSPRHRQSQSRPRNRRRAGSIGPPHRDPPPASHRPRTGALPRRSQPSLPGLLIHQRTTPERKPR